MDFLESCTREIRFPETEGEVLEKTCQFLYHVRRIRSLKMQGRDREARAQDGFEIPPELNMKMLVFASMLDL